MNAEKDESGNYPIHLAVSSGKLDITRLLIKNRADVNLIENIERTPIYLSTEEGNIEIMKELT